MTVLYKPNEDHGSSPVPSEEAVSGWQIALVKIGVIIALPAFLIGANIGTSMGLLKGGLTFFVAGLILLVIAGLTGTIGAKSRLSTSMIIQFSFGRFGARVINLILSITLLGWFGVTAELFGRTLSNAIEDLFSIPFSEPVCVVLGGVLMIATTIFGFRALQRLANAVVPLLMLGLLIVAYLAVAQVNLEQMLVVKEGGPSFGCPVCQPDPIHCLFGIT